MNLTMLKSKLHRATITDANLHYEGSITIDAQLMEAAGIIAYEQVHVLDISNGARLVTYAIEGEPGSGILCTNGPAAHLIPRGDLVTILAYADMPVDVAKSWQAKVIHVDGENKLISTTSS